MNLVANPSSPSWDGRTPTIDDVTIDFFASDTALVNALAAGTVDLSTISVSDVGALNTTSSLTITQIPTGSMTYLNLRNVGYPWNETDFRQALLYLVNKNQINSVVYDNRSAIENAAVLPGSSQWLPSNLPAYSYNPATAEQLLQDAGLHKSAQGTWLLANGTALPPIVFQAADSDSSYVRVAQLITSDWQSAGLQVTLEEEPISTVNGAIYSTGTFDVAYTDGGFLPVPWRYAYNAINFPSGAGGAWSNSTYSLLKTEADAAPTTSVQDQLLQTLVLTLAQNAIVDGLASDLSYVAYNNQRFTNVSSAIQGAAASDFFIYPPFAESVLTSVTPTTSVSFAPSTSSASSAPSSSAVTASATSTSSTSGGSALLTPTTAVLVAVAAIVVLAGIALSLRRRREDAASSSGHRGPT
jgi:ABC-type transport system substrate-binding protein